MSISAQLRLPAETDHHTRRIQSLEGAARVVFIGAMSLVVVLGIVLALRIAGPGHWDSINNLATARNLAEGRGFVSDVVQQLAVPEPLPGPETVRAPGVPYLMAAVFSVFGVSYAALVVVNLLVVVLTSLCVRQAVREGGGTWHAELLGALVLCSHAVYEMRSLWNNGILALLTAFFLLLLVRHVDGRLVGWRFAMACAVLTAAGFFMKQTFMLGALPFAVGLLLTDVRQPLRARIGHAAGVIGLFALLTSPYWATNLARHGQALYSPIQGMRLPTRYGILPTDRFHRTLRFGAEAYGYGAVAREIGVRELLEREVAHWMTLARTLFFQNPFVSGIALVGLAFARLRDWRQYAAILALLVPPVFDSSYWIMEPRYLFAAFPCTLFLAWLALRNWASWVEADTAPRAARRVRLLGSLALAGALAYAALPGARQWRWDLIAARTADPAWVSRVRALPDDAVILAAYPPEVAWYTRHRAVIAPLGARSDVAAVVRHYRTSYFLDMEPSLAHRRVPFAATDLIPVASGPDWRLYRIDEGSLLDAGS